MENNRKTKPVFIYTSLQLKKKKKLWKILRNQSSVAQSCLTLCNPTDFSMSAFPVLHYLPELLKLMSVESMVPSNCLILCHLLLLLLSIFPSIRVFSNELALHIRCQSIGVSASASVLPMNIQGWFPLGLAGLILLSRGVKGWSEEMW